MVERQREPCRPAQGDAPFVTYLRVWLEGRDVAYVVATRCNDMLITTEGTQARADALVTALPARAWRRISAGTGAHGPREYDWTRIPIRIGRAPGPGHWLLARRSITNPTEIAYYVRYGPAAPAWRTWPWTAGAHRHIEECLPTACRTIAGFVEIMSAWAAANG